MVATAIALHLRAKNRLVSNPRFPLLFSSSSSSTNSNEVPHDGPTSSQSQSQPDSTSSSTSYFSDIKAKLRQPSHQQPQRNQPYPHQPFSISSSGPSSPGTPKVATFTEIRKSLSEFQRRASPPPPQQSSSTTPRWDPISFQGLYQPSLISKGGESIGEARRRGEMSFSLIRDSLKRINNKNRDGGDRIAAIPLSKYKESFNLKPADPNARGPSSMFGGTNNLPSSVFGKEMKEEQSMVESPPMKTEFMKMYTYDQLGDKLKKLRPDTKDENWFSFTELNERLVKLREMEQKEIESRVGGVMVQDLRESMKKIVEGEKKKTPSVQRLDIISRINETPFYMQKPPNEQLFEKYLHPDNMSSSELMKLELAKVREEFKMSESDCGSARVQVAQLTTKIKHLSKVLHKKDKHSRKGLIEMVERRKKLLRYLRRTDWDSYCLVLSKLGLRDKPTEKGLIKR